MKMWTRYAEYYQDMKNPMVGTDSILPIDGRLSIANAVDYVANHPRTIWNRRQYNCIGFKIIKNNNVEYSCLNSWNHVSVHI